MKKIMLFTDGSVDAQTQIGFGAYLAVTDSECSFEELKAQVKVKQFENTSSTKLELETLLWAIKEILLLHTTEKIQIFIHTDSQNIVSLPTRRANLESQNFVARNHRRLNNAELYQDFYRQTDICNCLIIKIEGHKPQPIKNTTDKIFSLVDKASRFALREFNLNAHPANSLQNLAD